MPPRRPVARTQAPCVPAPWRRWAAYGGVQASCGGEGTPWALPGRERAPGTRESTRENAHPWPPWLQWPPQAPAVGPGPAHLGPGSPQVNAFCGYQGPQAADPFTGRGGVRALWDPGRIAHGPFSQSSAQTLESRSVSVQVYRLGAGWGRLSRERLLAPQAGLRPKTPPRDPVPGRGSGLPGTPPRPPAPPPPGPEPWPAPLPGPRSLVLPRHSASGGVGDGLASVVHGKRIGPLGGGESFQFHGTRPQGPCEAGLICPGWGPLPRGRLLVGLPALSLPGPASWPETGQPRL